MLYTKDAKNFEEKKPRRNEWLRFFVFVCFILVVRSFLFSPFRIPSGSMIPTLQVGDFLVMSKYDYGFSRYSLFMGGHVPYFSGKIMGKNFPKRGEVLVFTNPNNTKEDWIKRVIGLPGDVIEMRRGRLYINHTLVPLRLITKDYEDHDGEETIKGTLYIAEIPGQEKDTPFCYKVLKQKPFGEGILDNMPPTVVPENHVFCMGDNWDGSGDSRNPHGLGMVSSEYFLGKPRFIYFSVDHSAVSLFKPWTWLMLPFNIRFNRCIYKDAMQREPVNMALPLVPAPAE